MTASICKKGARETNMYFLAMEMGGQKFIDLIRANGIGRLVITSKITPYPGEQWAFDNGAFGFYRRNQPFDMKLYLKRLDMAASIGEPLFVVAPDIVMGGISSLEFSNAWMHRHESSVFRYWYLAVQDGMSVEAVEDAITKHSYHGLFLGGSNEFKYRSGETWKEICRTYGLKFHYARCGTRKKIMHAKAIRANSIDSALPIWRSSRLNDLNKMLKDAE